MKHFFTSCISLLLVFGFLSCKKHKLNKNEIVIGASTTPSTVVPTETKEVKPEPSAPKVYFNTEQIDFNQIKIKSKIEIKSVSLNQNIPATLHVRKDSTIWISVAMGLEAARASISPDSLFALDRLNKKYYKLSFNELSERFNFPFNYEMIQSLLIGNLPIPVNNEDIFLINKDFNSITQKRNNMEIVNKFDKVQKKLYVINAVDKEAGTNLDIEYKSFTTVDNIVVPKTISIKISNAQNGNKTEILIEHSKFDFLDRNIRFPFSIPKSYSAAQLPNF